METPGEIKEWLSKCANTDRCGVCMMAHSCENNEAALAYINQLEADLARVTAERDAAVQDIPRACGYCSHFLGEDKLPHCENWDCKNISGINTGWEWRGVKEDK